MFVAAMFTSFYSWRLIFMTFHGEARGDKHTHEHAHESPWTMLAPLGVLSLGAIFAGMIWFGSFFGDHDEVNEFYGVPLHHAAAEGHGEEKDDHGTAKTEDHASDTHKDEHADDHANDGDMVAGWTKGDGAIFTHPDNHVMDAAHHAPKWVKVSPFIAMLIGLGMAWLFYIRRPDLPGRLAENQRPLYNFLLNKWYFDELFDWTIVRPTKFLGGFLWRRGDGNIIDGGINGLAMGIVPFFTRLAGRAQSGYIFTYAFFMVIGIVGLVTWMTLSGGAN